MKKRKMLCFTQNVVRHSFQSMTLERLESYLRKVEHGDLMYFERYSGEKELGRFEDW